MDKFIISLLGIYCVVILIMCFLLHYNTFINKKELKVNKNLLEAYKNGTEIQRLVLEKTYGKEIFSSDWQKITSYEKACEVLGIHQIEIMEVGDRPQYMKMANAMQQLLVICEAINGKFKRYDEDGLGYYPIFTFYSKEEMQKIKEVERSRKDLYYCLTPTTGGIWGASARYMTIGTSRETTVHGFPLCLNSEEKARFVGKQFFELWCAYYDVAPE